MPTACLTRTIQTFQRACPLVLRVQGVQRQSVQPLHFGHPRQLQAYYVGVIPAQSELHREGNRHCLAHSAYFVNARQIA